MTKKISSIELITGSVESTIQKSITRVEISADAPCRELLVEFQDYVEQHDVNIERMLREELNLSEKTRPSTVQRVGKLIRLVNDCSRVSKYPIGRLNDVPCYFNGKYWEFLRPVMLGRFFSLAGQIMGIAPYESEFDSFIAHAIESFAYAEQQTIRKEKGKTLLNCMNGTLEIKPGEEPVLREYRPEDGMTYVLPYNYDKTATAPKFMKVLTDALPLLPDQQNLQEFVGSIFSDVNHEKVAYLYGPTARNGKSTLMTVLNAVLGENNTSSESLTHLTQNDGTGECSREKLEGKLLNTCGDIDCTISSSGIFKTLASRERFTVRPPYARASRDIQAGSYARLMFNCNNLPTFLHGAANAEAARFLFIYFDHEVPVNKRVLDLAQQIVSTELPGVLNWAIEGLKRLVDQNGRFTENQSANDIRDKFLEGSNSVVSWLNEIGLKPATSSNKYKYPEGSMVVYNLKSFYKGDTSLGYILDNYSITDDIRKISGAKVEKLANMFSYVNYCNEAGRKVFSRTNFYEALEQQGFFIRHTKIWHNAIYVWIPSDEELERERESKNRRRTLTVFDV